MDSYHIGDIVYIKSEEELKQYRGKVYPDYVWDSRMLVCAGQPAVIVDVSGQGRFHLEVRDCNANLFFPSWCWSSDWFVYGTPEEDDVTVSLGDLI